MANGVSRLMGLLTVVVLGCEFGPVAGGAGAGNPPSPQVEIALSVQAVSQFPSAQAKAASAMLGNPWPFLSVRDSAATLIRLDSLQLLSRAIEIGLPEGRTCADAIGLACLENEISIAGPFHLDLVSGRATPPLTSLKLPHGIYMQVGLEPLAKERASDSAGGGDSGLVNLFIQGSISPPGAGQKNFVLEIGLEDGIDFIHPSGIPALPDSLNVLMLALLVDGWFTGVDMAACLASSDAKADTTGVLHVRGNAACGGIGLRMQKSIDMSGNLEEEEEIEE